eukprot:scaffold3572_cov125-Isochrysis_galbana.AAC.6
MRTLSPEATKYGTAAPQMRSYHHPAIYRGACRWALMPREVADVYASASAAFSRCAVRSNNSLTCGRRGKPTSKVSSGVTQPRQPSGQRPLGALAGMPPDLVQPSFPGGGRHSRDQSWSSHQDRRLRVDHEERSRPHSPHWATPQCILGRWLTERAPNIVVTSCLEPRERPRLIRPEQVAATKTVARLPVLRRALEAAAGRKLDPQERHDYAREHADTADTKSR